MSTQPPKPEGPASPRAQTSPLSAEWLRHSITLTVERWMLIAAGVAALVLLLIALD